jgi:FG-GAP repeat/FG-GAP-like repeat
MMRRRRPLCGTRYFCASSMLVVAVLLLLVTAAAAPARERAVGGRADGAFWLATPHELRLRGSVGTLAADGNRVAFSSCWWTGAVWQPGHDPHFFGSQPASDVCTNPPLSFGGFSSFAVAGERVAYLLRGGGIGVFGDLVTASAQDGYQLHNAASFGRCCAGDPVGSERWGDLVGGGDTIAYATWEFCGIYTCDGSPVHVTTENVNRVDESCVASAGVFACPHLPNPGALVPLAAGRGRILARRGDGALVELRTSDLAVLRTFSRVGRPLDAALAGRTLVVLVRGALRVLDAQTGRELHRWPVPGVPLGSVCTELPYQCPSPELEFAGAADGLAAYIADGVVHVIRLSNGVDLVVARATHARITSAGLFYAYAGRDPWPGRVRFVPRAQLFRAQILPGSPAPPPRTDLFAQTTLQMIGPFPDSHAGSSIAAVGDVNGDGRPDFIVGTETASPKGRSRAGSAFVVFGRRKPAVVQLAKLGARGFEIDGSAPEAFAGNTVAGLGDVNGDGLPDVLVCCTDTGASAVILGTRSPQDVDVNALGKRGFLITGATASTLAGAGDMDGDGLADIAIAGPPDAANAAWVVYGKRDTAPVDLADLGDGGFSITGPNLGIGLAGLHDVNGDGLADLGLSFSGFERAGVAVVFGSRTPHPVDANALGDEGFMIENASYLVAPAGDVNRDGLADIAVSGRGVAVVFGRRTNDSVDLTASHFGGFAIAGSSTGPATAAGDVNGDGRPDLLVASPFASNGGPFTGTVYLFSRDMRRPRLRVHALAGVHRVAVTASCNEACTVNATAQGVSTPRVYLVKGRKAVLELETNAHALLVRAIDDAGNGSTSRVIARP